MGSTLRSYVALVPGSPSSERSVVKTGLCKDFLRCFRGLTSQSPIRQPHSALFIARLGLPNVHPPGRGLDVSARLSFTAIAATLSHHVLFQTLNFL